MSGKYGHLDFWRGNDPRRPASTRGERRTADLRAAIAEPEPCAIEPKVDGVRGLIVYQPEGTLEARNRRALVRDWFRHRPFRTGLLALADRLPILWQGTVLDGERSAGRFETSTAAIQASSASGPPFASSSLTCLGANAGDAE